MKAFVFFLLAVLVCPCYYQSLTDTGCLGPIAILASKKVQMHYAITFVIINYNDTLRNEMQHNLNVLNRSVESWVKKKQHCSQTLYKNTYCIFTCTVFVAVICFCFLFALHFFFQALAFEKPLMERCCKQASCSFTTPYTSASGACA